MEPFAVSIFEGISTTLLAAVITGMWVFLAKMARQQKEANSRTRDFEKSMQRAEIIRYFRIVVEQGKPISPEELNHLDSCYKAYHALGGNGTGTVMYNKIMENVKIVTSIEGGDK